MDSVQNKVFPYGEAPGKRLSIFQLDAYGNLKVTSNANYSSDSSDGNKVLGSIQTTVVRLEAFNGTTYDRLRVDANKNLLIADNTLPPFSFNTDITVTNVSQEFAAQDEGRKSLIIQNNDPIGTIYVSFSTAATLLNGIKIPPGGYFEPNVVPRSAINIIGSAAVNSNVVFVVGS